MTSETASGRSNLRVLVVEDDPNSRKVLVHALDAMKAELTLAENGAQAVDAFRKAPFDVVLMDLQMPVMDGYAATREIRAHESRGGGGGRTPILVVSAHTRPWEIEAAQSAGADHHLGKPINVPALLGTIEAVTTPL
ncbi:MAG TPA: response regulator [Brevundimonas sp.]